MIRLPGPTRKELELEKYFSRRVNKLSAMSDFSMHRKRASYPKYNTVISGRLCINYPPSSPLTAEAGSTGESGCGEAGWGAGQAAFCLVPFVSERGQ